MEKKSLNWRDYLAIIMGIPFLILDLIMKRKKKRSFEEKGLMFL
jgi:hypothetical protein